MLEPSPNRRAARPLMLALALLGLALLLVPGALARSSHPGKHPCSRTSAHRVHGAVAGRCPKHASHKTKPHSHSPAKHERKARKPAHKRTPGSTVAMTPASCEDGSAPVRERSGAPFECGDGSEPACEDGSKPTRSSAGAVPLCPAGPKEVEAESCEPEAEEGECPACEAGAEPCQAADPGEEPES